MFFKDHNITLIFPSNSCYIFFLLIVTELTCHYVFQEKFMKGRGVPRLTELDIHVICGCLKDFLRNLKEPLVTHALWWQFTRASELRDVEERKAELYQAVSQLPQANRDTLAYLILHLLR